MASVESEEDDEVWVFFFIFHKCMCIPRGLDVLSKNYLRMLTSMILQEESGDNNEEESSDEGIFESSVLFTFLITISSTFFFPKCIKGNDKRFLIDCTLSTMMHKLHFYSKTLVMRKN